MKPPDRIYVVPDFVEGLSLDRKDFDDEVCYIRKDALIEWLEEGYEWVHNPLISVSNLIDKLNLM